MAHIHLFIGSVMGTAEQVAITAAQILLTLGHQAPVSAAFEPEALTSPDSIALICTSNTGMGDLPANIAPMHAYLTNECPVLTGKRYGIINLGDSSYPNFAQAGQSLDVAMANVGGKRIGEPLILDAIYVNNYAKETQTWIKDWEQQL